MARRPLSTSKQLLALLDKFSPSIRSAFLAAISDIRSATVLARVIDAIELGDVTAAFQALGFSQAAMRPLTAMVEQAFERGGVLTADAFPRLGINRAVFRFDVRNSRAEAWLRDHSSTLVTNIGEDIRLSVRNMMTLGVEAGRNPRNIALDIVGRVDPVTGRRKGGVVGLTGQQSAWVGNARQELANPDTASHWFTRKLRDKRFDKIVQRSITDGVALDADTVARLTGRYSDSLLRMRGETIGRTEALQSMNHSSDEAFRQAVDAGLIKPEAVMREWDATGNDGRTRETHLAMDGQVRRFDEPFMSPSGAMMMFPGDFSLGAPPEEIINCRCVIKHRVDFLAGVK